MDMKLELVPIPVADVDRAKAFYTDKLGFNIDHDHKFGDNKRVCQLTPPGSACSIVLGVGLGMDNPPGSVQGLHLVVADIRGLREQMVGQGMELGEVQDMGGILYVSFKDPDGNGWAFQEIPATVGRPEDVDIDHVKEMIAGANH